ncbi:hypothetical protein BDC45DRAFT_64644 [Circinella umbellata]|nr:hypothetical protein BDC45DRAFT_64644 [Circinella umbellata]
MTFSSSASAGPNATIPEVVSTNNNNNELVDNKTHAEYFVTAPPPLHQRKTEYPVAIPMRTDTTPIPNMMPRTPSSHSTNSAILLELNVQYDHPTIAKDPNVISTDGSKGFCTICRPVVSSSQYNDDDKNNSNLIFYRPQMALHKVLQQGVEIVSNDEQQKGNEQQDGKITTATVASATTTVPTATNTTVTSSTTATSIITNNSATDTNNNTTHTRVTVPSHLLPYVTLYGPRKQALWSLTSKDWHTMDFASPQLEKVITLTTSTSLFSFLWINRKAYQWRLIPITTAAAGKGQQKQYPYDLRCYQDDKLIAEFVDSRFIQWSTEEKEKPGQQQNQKFNFMHDIQFTSFLLLSGLLIHEHLSSILRSLGGGPEAVQLVTDPTFAATAMMDDRDNDYDDDYGSLGSFYTGGNVDGEREFADQGLVDGQTAPRAGWYSSHSGVGGHHAGSIKSIELDPGCMRCFWGYGFWWTWCPCCMPGGWFDRLWINCRLRRRKILANSSSNISMSRSRQRRQRGWQQHHPDQY